jgi:hypothetical protein
MAGGIIGVDVTPAARTLEFAIAVRAPWIEALALIDADATLASAQPDLYSFVCFRPAGGSI